MKHFGFPVLILIVLTGSSLFSQAPAGDVKTNYAVVNLKSGEGVSEGESELISDRLRTELFKTGKVNMMERNQMQDILNEQGFQQSGACTDEACLVEMGQMLGVKIMVIGSLGKLGSMFMINIRAIDVQTAQIVKVVSVDIKGDIEEVVDHLEEIARKITGTEGANQPAAEPPPAEEVAQPIPEPQPEPAAAPPVETPPVEPEADGANDKKSYEAPEKNRNRGGVGFTFTLFGNPSHYVDGNDIEQINVLDTDSGYYIFVDDFDFEKTTTPIMDFLIRFYIRVGKYLNIEIGPHFTTGSETYTVAYPDWMAKRAQLSSDALAEFFIGYYIPGVHVGVDFVKRIHPLKINAGVFANIAVPLIYYSYDGYSNSGEYFSNDNFTALFNVIPGIRTGAEFLAGQRVGFAVDFVLQVLRFELDYDFDEYDLGTYDYEATTYTQEVMFPAVGIGFSVNLYF